MRASARIAAALERIAAASEGHLALIQAAQTSYDRSVSAQSVLMERQREVLDQQTDFMAAGRKFMAEASEAHAADKPAESDGAGS